MKSKEAKQRQQIFLNTLDMIRSDKSLSEAVEASIEALSVYGENEYPRLAVHCSREHGPHAQNV